MPTRYLEAERLKRHLAQNPEEWYTPDERWLPEHDIALYIDTCPESDAVEVVRCKDCKDFDEVELAAGKKRCFCYIHGENFPPDYFCASGRKEYK